MHVSNKFNKTLEEKMGGHLTHHKKVVSGAFHRLSAGLFFVFYPLGIKNPFASSKSLVDLKLQHRQVHPSPHVGYFCNYKRICLSL